MVLTCTLEELKKGLNSGSSGSAPRSDADIHIRVLVQVPATVFLIQLPGNVLGSASLLVTLNLAQPQSQALQWTSWWKIPLSFCVSLSVCLSAFQMNRKKIFLREKLSHFYLRGRQICSAERDLPCTASLLQLPGWHELSQYEVRRQEFLLLLPRGCRGPRN